MPVVKMPDGANVAFPDDMPHDQIRGLIEKKFPQAPADFNARFSGVPAQPIENAAAMEQGLQATAPVARGGFLPVSKNTRTGEVFFDPSTGVLGAIKRAFELPGDVAAGNVQIPSKDAMVPGSISDSDPGARDATGRVLEAATLMSPISPASRLGTAAAPSSVTAARNMADFKASSGAGYNIARNTDFVVKPTSLRSATDDIARTVIDEGIDPTLHPGSMAALKRLNELDGQPVTLKTLDTMRQIISDAKGSNSAGERRMASIIQNKLDSFVENLSAKDVLAGSPEEAVSAIKAARADWMTYKKLETINDLVVKARDSISTYSASGLENALRVQFRQLSRNKKAMRTFTEEEQAAIRGVARGGLTTNFFRILGKMAPTSGVVGPMIGGTAGASMGGPFGAAAMLGGAQVARTISNRATNKAVDKVFSTIATRGEGTPSKAASSVNDVIKDVFRRSVLFGGEQQLLPRSSR